MPPILELKTTVLPGQRIEISSPELQVGQQLTVTLRPVEAQPPAKDNIVEFIKKHRKPLRSFSSWEEMEKSLQAERDSWD
ncbi:MAG: hypothetical protein QM703_09960 [Gemmatales bacterium]